MKLKEITENFDRELIISTMNDWGFNGSFNVDAQGFVNITNSGFSVTPEMLVDGALPAHIKFGKVAGNFNFHQCHNTLKSLIGAPHTVDLSFSFSDCHLVTEWAGVPRKIGNHILAKGSGITTLVGISELVEKVGNVLVLPSDNITSGGLGLLMIPNRGFNTGSNHALALIKAFNEQPEDIFECQTRLIEKGYEVFAQL